MLAASFTHLRVHRQLGRRWLATTAPATPPAVADTPIFFAQTREDPLIDIRALRMVAKRTRRGDLRVLTVGSGGCTVLSLLAQPNVSEVHAVDMNPSQLHLLELKRALIDSGLPLQAVLDFLGSSVPAAVSGAERLATYDLVRPALTPDAAAFWDAHLEAVAAGVNRCGRFEAIFREMADSFKEAGVDPIQHPVDALSHTAWTPIFQRVFDRQRLTDAFGPEAVNYSMSQQFSDHFSRVFAAALRTYNPFRNYFLHSLFRDCYAPIGTSDGFYEHEVERVFQAVDRNNDGLVTLDEVHHALNEAGVPFNPERIQGLIAALTDGADAVDLATFQRFMSSARDFTDFPELQALLGRHVLPEYLHPVYASQARGLGLGPSRLHYHNLPFAESLQQGGPPGEFDLIQTSNITDWMSPEDAGSLMELVRTRLKPGGAVLARRLNGDYELDDVVAKTFATDHSVNQGLTASDRSFFYNEVVVGFNDNAPTATSDLRGKPHAGDSEDTEHPWWFATAAVAKADPHGLARMAERRVIRPTQRWLTPELLSAQPSFDAAVRIVEQAYDFHRHPYIEWMQHPDTTREAFRATQTPFKYAVERWSQSVAAVIAGIPTTPGRLHVYENLAEEHGYGKLAHSHVATFTEFLVALGVAEDSLVGLPVPIHIHSFNEALLGFCGTHSAFAGAAALGVIEGCYVGVSEEISSTIVERRWVLPDSQRHYAVHSELDVQHAKDLLDVARPAWDDSTLAREEVASGLLFAAHQFWGVYGGMLVHGVDVEDAGK